MTEVSQGLDAIKAYRVPGGAVVTVCRADGRVHRHRVGLRRYNRLADTLGSHLGLYGGSFTRNGFECRLREVQGLADARRWAARNSSRRSQHWKESAR
ncbi:MAG: hypothetical protein ACT4NV_14815 [Rhodoferax sp.]